MGKIIFWLCLSFFFIATGVSYGMSALEKEYKDQMKLYNFKLDSADFNIKMAQKEKDNVRGLIQLCHEQNMEALNKGYRNLVENCESKYESKLNKAEDNYKDCRKERDEISEKKQALRIKVVEKL